MSEFQGTPWDHVLVMYPVDREGGTTASSAVEHRIAAFEDAHRDVLSGDAERSRAWTFPILANDLERRYLRWLGEVPDFGTLGRRVRGLGTLVRQALWGSLGILLVGLVVRLSMGNSLGELVMFIALKIVGVLYGIGLVLAGIAGIAVLFGSFAQGGISILIGLIGAPLVFLLYVLLIRVALESMIAAFRTASNTARIAENTRRDV